MKAGCERSRNIPEITYDCDPYHSPIWVLEPTIAIGTSRLDPYRNFARCAGTYAPPRRQPFSCNKTESLAFIGVAPNDRGAAER